MVTCYRYQRFKRDISRLYRYLCPNLAYLCTPSRLVVYLPSDRVHHRTFYRKLNSEFVYFYFHCELSIMYNWPENRSDLTRSRSTWLSLRPVTRQWFFLQRTGVKCIKYNNNHHHVRSPHLWNNNTWPALLVGLSFTGKSEWTEFLILQ